MGDERLSPMCFDGRRCPDDPGRIMSVCDGTSVTSYAKPNEPVAF